jgi:hypothetical protein
MLNINITLPAIVTLVGYLLMVVLILVPFDMSVWDDEQGEYVRLKYNVSQRLFIVFLMLFPLILGVYSVNCFVVGNCTVLSWAVALLTIVWAAAVIVSAVLNKSFYIEDVLN